MHKVYFVGCGPGDPDLITVKAKKLMQKAQTIVYSGSLIPPKTLKICKGEMHDASGMVREEITLYAPFTQNKDQRNISPLTFFHLLLQVYSQIFLRA